MRVRPTEIRMVRDMLMKEEWEDEAECAEAIIARLDEVRGKERTDYCLAVQHPTQGGVMTALYGPYPTPKAAERAYRKGTGQVADTDRVAVFPMVSPLRAEQALES